MRNRPRLVVTCARCGKSRTGLRHDCVSNSSSRATVKPSISFGKCPKCKKTVGNPLTHVCAPKSDFKARKRKAAKREKAKQAEQHPFESCRDSDCKRPQCVAYRTGWHEGHIQGFDEGYEAGYAAGAAAGYAAGFAAGSASSR